MAVIMLHHAYPLNIFNGGGAAADRRVNDRVARFTVIWENVKIFHSHQNLVYSKLELNLN